MYVQTAMPIQKSNNTSYHQIKVYIMSKKGLPIIYIGADPEVFVKDSRRRAFVSAHPYVSGTKSDPLPWKGGAIQVDGVALEFNIPAARNARAFSQSIRDNVHYLQGILNGWDDKLKLTITPTAYFDKTYFDNLPEEVKMLGCEPDYNAYTLDVNPKPHTDAPKRTGSGHVHIGWLEGEDSPTDVLDPDHMAKCADLVQQLDIALFVPSLLFDKDSDRRSLYGAPGAFRPKKYGVEYRVLSNRWLRNDSLTTWVFNATLKATRDFFNGKKYSEKIDLNELLNIYSNLSSRRVDKLARSFISSNPSICSIPPGFSGGNSTNRKGAEVRKSA